MDIGFRPSFVQHLLKGPIGKRCVRGLCDLRDDRRLRPARSNQADLSTKSRRSNDL